MKKLPIILLIALSLVFILCCSRNDSYRNQYQAEASTRNDTSSLKGIVSSSAAVQNNKDTSRKFIRTAEIKFRVKSVLKATYKIEEITTAFNGIVTYTALNSRIENTSTQALSPDSSLETIHFTVANILVVRVPNYNLDSTLRAMGDLIEYLDYRNIKAEDVSLRLLSNNLAIKRIARHEERLSKAIDGKGKKLNETISGEENLLQKQEETDNSRISTLSLEDQIRYSTLSITIYQRQETKRWLIANEKSIREYEPGYGTQFVESLRFGWSMLAELMIFITRLWALVLAGILIFVSIKIYRHRVKK